MPTRMTDGKAKFTDKADLPTDRHRRGGPTMSEKFRLGNGEVVTRDELRALLTAELDALDAETRAANCDGTIDDLITDSMLVGTYRRVDDEDGQSG